MNKKINILLFLVIAPNLLALLYDKLFRYSGNWFEDYQNYFKLAFIGISLAGSVWLSKISLKERSVVWSVCSILLAMLLVVYLYFAVAIANSSY